MVDPFDILLDNRALIEIGGHIVGGGPNDFHAAGVGLRIGLRALKARQERMVDVDGTPGPGRTEPRRQDLHIPR